MAQNYVKKIETHYQTYGRLHTFCLVVLKLILTAVLVIQFKNMIFISSRIVTDQQMCNNGIYPILQHEFTGPLSDTEPDVDFSETSLSK